MDHLCKSYIDALKLKVDAIDTIDTPTELDI